jgi:hypothetical protein
MWGGKENLSLVVAFSGSREAIIGGDRRVITFLGGCPALEEELYSGNIRTDQELLARAKDLGASLQVSDEREKVWMKGDLLVGEVTEIAPKMERCRRIYLTPGASLMVDITGREAKIKSRGKVECMVFGNRFTQNLAATDLGKAGGKVNEDLIRSILAKAGEGTASVSRNYTVLKTKAKHPDPDAALLKALEEDCLEHGWMLCAQQ